MKSFLASFFGTLAALVVLIAGIALGVSAVVNGLAASREATDAVPRGSYLVFDLSDQIQDAPLQNEGIEELARLVGDGDAQVLQARPLIRALQAAAADPDILGLYLSGQDPSLDRSTGYAALKEVRDAVSAFRAAGKPVKAWLSFAGTREYYLASAADEVVLDPYGALLVPGLATQPVFFTGAFEKFGIGVQVTRVGKFKSAVEPYTRTDMSPESRLQTQKLLDDIWANVSGAIEESRKLEAGGLQRAADSEGLIRAEAAKQFRLVDRVAYVDEMFDELREATGTRGSKGPFKQISIAAYAKQVPGTGRIAKRRDASAVAVAVSDHEKLAIVYAEGTIVDGSGADQGLVWGDDLARELRKLRRDDSVKAVVLRVNSPGGSVSASEAIHREVRLIQNRKPLVVSMGSVAASGGYWISTYSERIFAEPTTITGSIGVFGLLFNVQELATGKLGLTFETVKTGRFADSATITRPKSPEELEVVQRSVDWIYTQFLTKVAESRKLDAATVDAIAQGRVWSGVEALKLGLVDEIGGLDAAVSYAANKAAVGEEFRVIEFPRPKPLVEALGDALGRKQRDKADGAAVAMLRDVLGSVAALVEYNDPRGMYARMPFGLTIR